MPPCVLPPRAPLTPTAPRPCRGRCPRGPHRPHRRLRQRHRPVWDVVPDGSTWGVPEPAARLRPRGTPGRGRPDRRVHARRVQPGPRPRRQHAGARHADHPRRARGGQPRQHGRRGEVPRHRSRQARRPVLPLRRQAGEHPRPGAGQDAGLRQPPPALVPGAEGRTGRPDAPAVRGLRPGAGPLGRHRAVQHRDQDRLRQTRGVGPPRAVRPGARRRHPPGRAWARG